MPSLGHAGTGRFTDDAVEVRSVGVIFYTGGSVYIWMLIAAIQS